MDSLSSGVTVTNTGFGTIKVASAEPVAVGLSEDTVYNLSFEPEGYEQNMKIEVTIPD